MKYILTFISILFCFNAFNQDKHYIYYLDLDLNPVAKTKAFYKGIGIFHDGTLEFKLYDKKNNKVVAVEHYTDSSLSIENGLFQSFHPNGGLASEGIFVQGVQDGLWMRWDAAGRTLDSTLYSKGNKLLEVNRGYYTNGILDSLVVENVNTDHLDKTFYNDRGRLVSEVSFIGQRGILKRYDSVMNVTTDTVTSRLQIEASYPGGEQAWTRYVLSQIVKHSDELLDPRNSGTCKVRFIVGKDGLISGAEALTMKGTTLAKIAVEIISKGPRWNPAFQYGRYVNAFREQPVSFTVQGH